MIRSRTRVVAKRGGFSRLTFVDVGEVGTETGDGFKDGGTGGMVSIMPCG